MSKENQHKNNHFIQKALAKNFSINGNIKWARYKTNEKGEFHILNTPNEKQPISIREFYEYEIEVGMNNLEADGMRVVNKVVFGANSSDDIVLSRKELITLKFHSLLTSVRTKKFRNDIENLNGDSLFNEVIKKSGGTAKEIQEREISLILKYYKTNKNGLCGDINEDLAKILNPEKLNLNGKGEEQVKKLLLENIEKNMNIDSSVLMNILNTINSRLVVFKFLQSKLMLAESTSFTEQNRIRGGIMHSFTPIAPNVGISLYFSPIIARGIMNNEKSNIFKNDISKQCHKVVYKNIDIMKKERIKFITKMTPKNIEETDKYNRLFWAREARKYQTKDDRYIYDVMVEDGTVADTCNAMALVHNHGQIIIYQKDNDIKDAEQEVVKRGIFRIEDYQ